MPVGPCQDSKQTSLPFPPSLPEAMTIPTRLASRILVLDLAQGGRSNFFPIKLHLLCQLNPIPLQSFSLGIILY